MKKDFQLLDVVALIDDQNEENLLAGQVGTIVEPLDDGVYEVESCDDEGRTYATLAMRRDQLMALHYSPVAA